MLVCPKFESEQSKNYKEPYASESHLPDMLTANAAYSICRNCIKNNPILYSVWTDIHDILHTTRKVYTSNDHEDCKCGVDQLPVGGI